jgi:hypothetical protein
MQQTTSIFRPFAPVALPVDFTDIDTFLTNAQKFTALPFSERCHLLIKTFGEDVGIEYAETLEQYGL